jgi:hypothetical protein
VTPVDPRHVLKCLHPFTTQIEQKALSEVRMNTKTALGLFVSLLLAAVLTVAPAPTPAHAATPIARCPKWEPLLRKHGLPVREFSKIMWRESRCEPRAIGWNYHKGKTHHDCRLSPAQTYRKCRSVRSYDLGLLQVNSSWRTLTAQICKSKPGDLFVLLTPTCNIKVSAYLYKTGGSDHWKATSGK